MAAVLEPSSPFFCVVYEEMGSGQLADSKKRSILGMVEPAKSIKAKPTRWSPD